MIRYRNAPDNSTPRFLSVRKNCADVLRQLAHFTTSRFYWIDAICINQAGKKEREQQVLLMSNVFGLAQCVLACVGMHQDDSEFLAQTLDEFDQSLASHHTSIDILTIRATESGNVPWITTSITEHSIEATCAHCFEWVKQLDADDNIDPPSKETLDHLQIGLCKTENSSFAQPPTRQRSWPASEFTYDTLSTCEVIVRDCYKDNNYYWFC